MTSLRQIKSYPYVTLGSLKRLPREPGVYYLVVSGVLVYTGQTENLWVRWNAKGKRTHHRKEQLQQFPQARLHYRILPITAIDDVEAQDINLHRPILNKQIPRLDRAGGAISKTARKRKEQQFFKRWQ